MRKFMEVLGPPVIALAILGLLIIAVFYPAHRFDKKAKAVTHTCLVNGYANYIKISGLNYCYRISGNQGELILAEALSQETGR